MRLRLPTDSERYLARDVVGDSDKGAVGEKEEACEKVEVRGITWGCLGRPTRVPIKVVGSAEPAKPALVKPEPRSMTTGWLRSKRDVMSWTELCSILYWSAVGLMERKGLEKVERQVKLIQKFWWEKEKFVTPVDMYNISVLC